jgi:hypothetical protein
MVHTSLESSPADSLEGFLAKRRRPILSRNQCKPRVDFPVYKSGEESIRYVSQGLPPGASWSVCESRGTTDRIFHQT